MYDGGGVYAFHDWNQDGDADDQYEFDWSDAVGCSVDRKWDSSRFLDGEPGCGELWLGYGGAGESVAERYGEQYRGGGSGGTAVHSSWWLQHAAE